MIDVEVLRRECYRVPKHAERPCLLCGLECLPGTQRAFLVAEIQGKDQIVSPCKEIGSDVRLAYIGPDCWQTNNGKLRKYQLPG